MIISHYENCRHVNVPQDSSWVDTNGEKIKGRSFEEVWRIREECIAA